MLSKINIINTLSLLLELFVITFFMLLPLGIGIGLFVDFVGDLFTKK